MVKQLADHGFIVVQNDSDWFNILVNDGQKWFILVNHGFMLANDGLIMD